MPTISINRDLLFKNLGKVYTDQEFDELCFEFGIELDDVVVEPVVKTEENKDGPSEETIYKIDIPANRYDLLCVEGLSRALLVYLEKVKTPEFKLVTPPADKIIKLEVLPNTSTVRPFAVGAVLRNVTFTKKNYNSFIELQDKLHQNLCRKRTLVAIGTHDLDTLQPPFRYDARRPKDIRFVPLSQTKEVDGAELMELYSKDSHLKPYLPIIQDKEFYPVIYDSKDVVCSLPPIINGDHSKITLATKNVFIECTATDQHKAEQVLDVVVTMFSEYCENKFEVEAVEVTYVQSGLKQVYPKLFEREETVNVGSMNGRVGINIDAQKMANLLGKMCLNSKVVNENEISVRIPPTRSDILHACDIIEDLGIAYGYNNIETKFPATNCFSEEFDLNKLSDLLRLELAHCGFTEALTFTLCSKEDVSEKLGKRLESVNACVIANPKTSEFQVVRTTLLSGLLRTVAESKHMPLPLKVFEVSDVVLNDKTTEIGARNERRLAVVFYNKQAGFEIVHGVLDRLMQVLESGWKTDYYLKHIEDPTFMPGRCAAIHAKGQVIGTVGVLHPQVIHNFELNLPTCALEINLEPFL